MKQIFVWPSGSCSGSGCVLDFSMFINAPTIEELFILWGKVSIYKKNEKSYRKIQQLSGLPDTTTV